MKTLIIDTATTNLYLAYVDNDIVYEVYRKNLKNHSEHLMNGIIALFNNNNLDKNELECIICGIGPGSYTGVRIGLTVAKMLAYSLNIKLKGISSLYMMGSGYGDKFASAIDARRGNVFCAYFEDGIDVIKEEHRNFDEFKKMVNCKIVEDCDYKVDYKNVINYSKDLDTHLAEPNYLRETEAERNL